MQSDEPVEAARIESDVLVEALHSDELVAGGCIEADVLVEVLQSDELVDGARIEADVFALESDKGTDAEFLHRLKRLGKQF